LTRDAMRARSSGFVDDAMKLERVRDAILLVLKLGARRDAEDFVLSIECGELAGR
jgi:hypothetical protein